MHVRRLARSRHAGPIQAAAAAACGLLIAVSVAACGPARTDSADAKPPTPAASTTTTNTTQDASLEAMASGSVAGGFSPLAGEQVASVPMGAGETVTVPVAGHGGVPASGGGAVALTVSTTGSPKDGSVTVYAAGASLPNVSSLSWPGDGTAVSGLVISALSSSGTVAVHNSSAGPITATLAADGYWLSGTPVAAGTFGPLAGGQVARVLVAGGQTVNVPVAGHGGVPAAGVGTVALAMAAATASGSGVGRIAVYPAGARPGLSWGGDGPVDGTASGIVMSALSSSGTVAVHNSSTFPVIVTLAAEGYWLSGTPAAAGTFAPAVGRMTSLLLGAGQTVTVPVAGHGDVPASDVAAVAMTVSATAELGTGSVAVYPAGASQPSAPSLTWSAHSAASGLAVPALSADGAVAVHNSSARAVIVTLATAGYWLSKARTVSDISAKPTTMTLGGSDVTAVSGDPGATQTVTLAPAAPVPAVGRVLVAPASAGAPDGLLGTVTSVTGGADGTRVVTLTPATLDEAYSTFDVSTSQQLTDSDVVETSAIQGGASAAQTQGSASVGQALSEAATPVSLMSRTEPAVPATGDSGVGYDLTKTQFDCDGTGAGPTVAVTADLSDTSVDLSLDANPAAPSIHFLVAADPVFDLNVGFTGQVTCTLAGERLMQVKIPVAATPPLVVDLYPVLTLTAGGQASVQFEWKPRAAVGFDEGPGIDSETHGFGSSGSVGISATAGADLFLGLGAELTLAGQVGVGGDLGPDLSVLYDAHGACVTVSGALKADLTANADVFVKDWSFALASGIFGSLQLYTNCGGASPSAQPSASPSVTAAPSTSSAPSAGESSSESWTDSPGALAGDTAGWVELSGVSCPSTSECFVVGNGLAPTNVRVPLLLTGSGQAWTAAQAPVPSGVTMTLGAVSCSSASQCVAIGSGGLADAAKAGAVVLTMSGNSWTAAQVSLPAAMDSTQGLTMTGISCPSAAFCVATGYYTDSTNQDHGLLLTWSGGSWTAAEAPLPSGADSTADVDLNGVSCPSASYCVATGIYLPNGFKDQDLLLTWSGGSWTPAYAPLPSNAASSGELSGVSCVSDSHCVAVGEYQDASGYIDGLLLTLSGGSWTPAEAPVPAGTSTGAGSVLSAVSCPLATQCAAVGLTSGNPTLLTLSGGSWTATNLPLPSNYNSSWGPGSSALPSVSCASASQCVAAGDYTDTSNQVDELLIDGPI